MEKKINWIFQVKNEISSNDHHIYYYDSISNPPKNLLKMKTFKNKQKINKNSKMVLQCDLDDDDDKEHPWKRRIRNNK